MKCLVFNTYTHSGTGLAINTHTHTHTLRNRPSNQHTHTTTHTYIHSQTRARTSLRHQHITSCREDRSKSMSPQQPQKKGTILWPPEVSERQAECVASG